MRQPQRVFVSIYCRILLDCFSQDMFNRRATGQEIYDFLMRDAGLCRDANDRLIPGDCNLWYLGCTDKYGCLKYQEVTLSWDFGESSFARVTIFVGLMYKDGVITHEQCKNLYKKIEEGRQINCMYDIKDYLIAKREGRPWVKARRAQEFRTKIMGFVARVEKHFEEERFLLYNPPTVH